MQNLLLLRSDGQRFVASEFRAIVEVVEGFYDVRFDEPGGAVIEAEYSDGRDSTIVRLNGKLDAISLTGMTDAALAASLILQQKLKADLRIIDSDYSFDLNLVDFAGIDSLQSAIEDAAK